MYDYLFKRARLFRPSLETMDLGITGDKITAINKKLEIHATREIDLEGRLVIPGFVDLHTHLEKTMTSHLINNRSGTLGEAIENFSHFFSQADPKEVYARARQAVEMAVAQGTTAIRSHITVDTQTGLDIIRAILAVKRDLADIVSLQVVAFPTPDPAGIKPEQVELLRKAVLEGADLVGGCPSLDSDYRQFTDQLFDLARELNTDIDFHVDESDEPNVEALEYLAEKIIAGGYQGRVTAGHCCSLSAVTDDVSNRVIAKVKEAGLSVVTLPSCNLFLMGRGDNQPVRRGVTRVRELLDAGVNVSYASDNIRDPFRPFGNADLLEEALLTAQVTQMGTPAQLNTILAMGTYNPAQAMNLEGYGLNEGCFADLVVLDAFSPEEAIVNQAVKSMVFRRGKLIVSNRRDTSELWKRNK
ncbi:amidohydrolase family protein [Paradesulfitobacterium ferrireducens]|uniref:amidohydrolase family protein n=1 Tax=Paradesulfitobacterium ferrireducens TaxID=2816476 RepID=UPI001A8DD3FA|nr:amidohydrolase family protein [Paradesulfitobacterium ferrireducens]